MTDHRYEFVFKPAVRIGDAELTLKLAILAAEGIHGEAGVRLGASYEVDGGRGVIVVETDGEVGEAVVRAFTLFLAREFGEGSFSVRRGLVSGAAVLTH